jgi:beta-glucosidase
LFENPYTDSGRAKNEILAPQSLQVARKLAQESIVLLKNENNLLPLNKDTETLAVLGPLADDKFSQLGPWAGAGMAQDAVTPLQGIKAKLPNAQVLYAKGIDIPSFEHCVVANANVNAPAPATALGATGTPNKAEPASIEDAVAAARKADVAIVFLGELAMMTGEASSRAYLDLPGQQQQLLEAIVATGKPVVLVIESGRPLDIRFAMAQAPAILQAWFPGVQAGHAIADLLFGDADPSGRLPLSWPRTVGQIPLYYNHKPTGRPISPDRWHSRYLDESSEPLFPFGYGLTYTSFKYGNLSVTPSVSAHGTLHVSAEVQNVGSRAGTEVVQLYVRDQVAPTSRPVRELKGFARVTLAPGEHKTVEFSVDANDLGSYDPQMKWLVPAGTYDVWVAPNAKEGVHGTFEVESK